VAAPAAAAAAPGTGLASDNMLAALALAASLAAPVPGPDPAGWERYGGKPKKPKLGEVLEAARADRDWHNDWLTMVAVVDDFIELRVHGRFDRDKEAIESGEIEHYWDPTIRNEHDKGCEELSSYDLRWDAPHRRFVDSDESRAKEAALALQFAFWQRQHDADGRGDLRWSLPDDAMRKGVIASSHVVDVHNEETGIRSTLYDPTGVYPSFEVGRGLARVTCCYRARADEALARYGDDPAVARKLRKAAKDDQDTFDPKHEFEMVEWWDRNWVLVAADEVEVFSDEHGRQRPPFVLTLGNYGKQRHTNSAQVETSYRDGLTLMPGVGVATVSNTRRDDRSLEAQPFAWKRIRTHAHKEAIGTHLTTHVRDAYAPAVVVQRTLQDRKFSGAIEVDYGQAGQTEVSAEGKIAPLKDLSQLSLAMSVLAPMIQQSDATSGLPPVAYGVMPGAQTSGTAAKELAGKGKEIYRPVAKHVARHLAACGEMWLEIWRDYGAGLGPVEEPGVILAPRRGTSSGGAHELTPELIERTGTRVGCELVDPDPLADMARVNAALMAMNSGLLTKWSVRKGIGVDPAEEQERQDRENLDEVPEIGQAKTLEMLLQDMKDAKERGDDESLQEAIRKAKFVTEQMWMNTLMKRGAMSAMANAGMGPPGGAAGGPPGGPEAAPPLGPDGAPMLPGQMPGGPPPLPQGPGDTGIGYQGASLPEYGIQTGVLGGRPPGMAPGEV
jgi:hypothetical protein